MAEYKDYLSFLQHVDDATLQEYKARELALKNQIEEITVQHKNEMEGVKAQYRNDIENIKAQHKKEIDGIKKEHILNVGKLNAQFADKEAAHKRELANITNENFRKVAELNKGIVNERAALSQNLANLQEKYDSLSARTTREARLKNLKISDCEKELAKAKHRIAELEGAIRQTGEKLDSLSNTRLLLLILVSVLTVGFFWVFYFIYYITAAPTYLSLKRWVACTKYVSPYVKK
ncbi:MAG: hypothetical protein E7088_09345 [Bacteroidales bacterium]|nr:hypothetical protein [Bacteroidales bacterium]